MRWIDLTLARIRSLFERRADDQVRADMRFHLDQATAEYEQAGLSPEAARRRALVDFGNPAQVAEQMRDQSPWIWLEQLRQDLRYGVRGFRRSPGFTATAVLSLALGIGANVAIFTVLDAAVLRPLPVVDPDGLVVVESPKIGGFTYQDYLAMREGNRTLSDLVGVSRLQRVNVGMPNDTVLASVKAVSGNYFAGLGVQPAVGRLLAASDETESVVVLSHAYWIGRLGGSPAIVGQTLRLDSVPFMIAGVAPSGFFGETPGESPELWTSLALLPPAQRSAPGFSWLNLVGRLQPGTALPQVQADLEALMANLHRTASVDDANARQIVVSPGARGLDRLRSRFGDPLRVLMGIVVLVLLIACANLGGLLIARSSARQAEIATRLAIGAGRARVVRQLLTESLLLAAVGGAVGLLIAVWGSRALVQLASGAGGDLVLDVAPGTRVWLFTFVVSIVSGSLFGLIPAVRAVRQSGATLVARGQRVIGHARRSLSRDAFIVAQVALSLVLLAASAMFIRTLHNLEAQDLGFQIENRLQVQIVRERGYRPSIATIVPALLERTRAIPGVTAASVAFMGALADTTSGVNGLQVDGFAPVDAQDRRAQADWVGPEYFRTVGLPLVAGRDFTSADVAGAQKVVIINEKAARHFFGDGAVPGRRFTFNKDEFEVVGVVRDAKASQLRQAPPRVIYFPVLQTGNGVNVLELRTGVADATTVTAAVRAAIREVDPRIGAGEAMTLSQRLDRKLNREHLVADISAFFGVLALILVSIGVYGTLVYTAATRTAEIGIRLALGSRRREVVWLMMRGIVIRVTIGLVLGTAGVLAAGPLVGSLLFGFAPNDVSTIAVSIGVLMGVAVLAGVVPTVRASRLDPASVLRQ